MVLIPKMDPKFYNREYLDISGQISKAFRSMFLFERSFGVCVCWAANCHRSESLSFRLDTLLGSVNWVELSG